MIQAAARAAFNGFATGWPAAARALLRICVLGALLGAGAPRVNATGPVLFYLEKQPKVGCDARAYDVATKQDAVLFKAEACPTLVVWDKPHGWWWAAVSGGVYPYPSLGPKPPDETYSETVGDLPVGELADLWIDKGTGKLRIAMLVAVPETDVVTYPSKGGKVVYRFGGKELDAKAVDAFDGLPYVAVIYEHNGTVWTQLEALATKTGAGEAPGIAVLGRRERSPKVWSLGVALDAMTCSGTVKGVSPNCEDDGTQAKAVLGNQDGYGSLDLGGGRKAVFPAIIGDTPHATGPVVLCTPECKPSGKLNGTESRDSHSPAQYGLAAKGGFLLIVGENRDLPVRVFDEQGKEVLTLPKVTVAAWWSE